MAKATRGKKSDKTDEVAKAEDSVTGEDSLAAQPDAEGTDTVAAEDTTEEAVTEDIAEEVDAPTEGQDSVPSGDNPEAAEAGSLTAEDSAPEADIAATDADDTIGAEDSAEAAQPVSEAAPTVIKETVVEKKSGFVPMLIGGVIAAGLGYGAAIFSGGGLPFGGASEPDPFVEETVLTLEGLSNDVATLRDDMGEAQNAIGMLDLTPVMTSLAGLEDSLGETTGALAGIEEQVAAFDSRLTAIEKQPLAEAVSPDAIAAYERELEELRQSIQEQRAAMDAQRAEIENIAAEAMQAEENAAAQAALSDSRAALAQVLSAVQEGEGFAEPLSVLTANGVTVPEALASTAQDGVPTVTALASDFPDLARAALRAARTQGGGDEESGGGGLAGFFQNQLGARSITPREGNDPDAVLSRAEAAVRSGDLATALDEISALPEPAQTALSDWAAQAALRADALAAADTLAQQLNQ